MMDLSENVMSWGKQFAIILKKPKLYNFKSIISIFINHSLIIIYDDENSATFTQANVNALRD